MRASLFFMLLAIIGLVAAGAAIFFRFRDAALHVRIGPRFGYSVPTHIGYDAAISGWQVGDSREDPSGQRACVSVLGAGPETGAVPNRPIDPPLPRKK